MASDTVYGSWLGGLIVCTGWGVPQEEAGPLAAVVLSSLQGAILLARVQRGVSVIHTVTERISLLAEQAVRT
ncbi:MAG: TetR/AcrR family transcriptional regulator [Actinomycetia bacterium]|nr:TetR/AcrR family transcriptional regulator [Actinomycetes bacterium]